MQCPALRFREGYPEIGEYWRTAAFEEAEHAAKFAEMLGEVVTPSTKKNLEMRVAAENGACAGKFDLAKMAKQNNLDAIHDTVHEMAKVKPATAEHRGTAQEIFRRIIFLKHTGKVRPSIKKIPERRNNMAKYVCPWRYVYDPEVGDPDNGIAPGTAWEDLPEDWTCPVCGLGKDVFEAE